MSQIELTSSSDESEKNDFFQNLKEVAKKRIPILEWLPKYKRKYAFSDIIAGTTCGLLVVPVSIAFAGIAGLSPEYGLYSSYLGAFLYIILGTCAQSTIGPVSILSLLSFEICGADAPQCVILTGFYSGIFELILAVLRLGWVINFVSEPVAVGFTSGAALTTISTQIKNLLGLDGKNGSGIFNTWRKIVDDIGTIKMGDSILGFSCLFVIVFLMKIKTIFRTKNEKVSQFISMLSISRNIIVLISSTLVAYIWSSMNNGNVPFKLTGNITEGFPTIGPPEFELTVVRVVNATDHHTEFKMEKLSFIETWTDVLKTGPIIVGLMALLQNVAVFKAFGGGGGGHPLDGTQEMYALGFCNLLGGFFSSMPVTGSLSRSAVNHASGVKTPLSGVFTGIIVLLSLGTLTSSFFYIPKATLASVIIASLFFMVDYDAMIPMWKISKIEFSLMMATFLSSILIGIEYGILIGVALSLFSLNYKSQIRILIDYEKREFSNKNNPRKPLIKNSKGDIENISINGNGIYPVKSPSDTITYLLLSFKHGLLHFPSLDNLQETISHLLLSHKNVDFLVFNFQNSSFVSLDAEDPSSIDFTVARTFVMLKNKLEYKTRVKMVFVNYSEERKEAFRRAGMKNLEKSFCDHLENVEDFLSQNYTL